MFDMYSLAITMWCVAVPLAAAGTFLFHWPVLVVYALHLSGRGRQDPLGTASLSEKQVGAGSDKIGHRQRACLNLVLWYGKEVLQPPGSGI